MEEYNIHSLKTSKLTTNYYSTSFSLGVRLLPREYRMSIYAIYGFVRIADEIVDTFHGHDKEKLLRQFRTDTFEAIENRVSTNPILHSFQWVVNEYHIDHAHIQAFLDSMEMDLTRTTFERAEFEKYVYGSAEVVGLMCLRVFYKDDDSGYEALKPGARKLGEAFQKINFLRDIHADYEERGRFYFPGVDLESMDDGSKKRIEEEIRKDFDEAYKAIRKLNDQSRLAVSVSYIYYLALFRKIRRTPAEKLFSKRYRISNVRKLYLLCLVGIRYKLGLA
jgi:phytoene synthase